MRGMTLIEITIALAIAGLMLAIVATSVNAITHANLRSSAIQLTGGVKYAYDRAIMEKRKQRIAMDLDQNIW